ncbi:unnamed protein product [Paramecium primaurelia]|uniref:AMP-dependent synthetase/ligase domain-containing protein n=1 Tax=Paramecium primaurelia TaxID=5886 RepID=A0A8S1MQQ5_PARPR|nr:unnamed protein product [Paramecium primaurelia]
MEEQVYISEEGMKHILQTFDPKDPHKNILWTTNYKMELPLRIRKSGSGSEIPITLPEQFKIDCTQFAKQPALSVKRNNKWITKTYQEYYNESLQFAKALIAYGISEMSAINIIGFNAPEWFISFMGSVHSHNLPVGIYTTNNPEACFYVSEHSECELVVVDTREQLNKYLQIWDKLPKLKGIVMYNDEIPKDGISEQRKQQIFKWKDFLEFGNKPELLNQVMERVSKLRPGNCVTLIYTSGTTGNPKGVMLSHDNYVFTITQQRKKYQFPDSEVMRIVSYLPLSHVAAQLIDIIGSCRWGAHIYFANPDALSGSLINTLKEVRPTMFFSVPRVWEKIYDQMQLIAKSNGAIKTKIATWAKSIGKEGTFAQTHGLKPPLCFGLADKLVYSNVKKALGLDQAKYLIFGAAPLSPVIREYFLSLNMYLINGYGMSECGGVTTLAEPLHFDKFDDFFMSSTGKTMEGTELKIDQPDKDGNGEICYRGRHIFMGYFKDEESTRNTIDKDRWLHSGDVGKLDNKGNLTITGRIKELIITAGGENVAPVLIENEFKKTIPIISNCMVIGDKRKYLSILLTLKHQLKPDGTPTDQLHSDVIQIFKELGSNAMNLEEAKKDPIISNYLQKLVDDANTRVISKAQYIRKWTLIPSDFSVDGGELTPTLKLKRRVVEQKWINEIEKMYQDAKL